MRISNKSLIFIVFVVASLSACSTSSTGRSQLVLKSDAALAQEGARQFAIIREKMPMVRGRATIDYVACRRCHRRSLEGEMRRTGSTSSISRT
jgi:hypothetical protein